MKKLLGVLLLLVIISIGGFFGYQKLTERKIVSLESIISDQALYYLYWGSPNKKIKDFQASNFFQDISASSVYKKFINPVLEKAQKDIAVVSDIMEEEMAFAMFSVSDLDSFDAGLDELGESVLLLRVSPKKHFKVKKAIADFYLSLAGKEQVKFEKYKGIKITNYKLPDLKGAISYALLSDVILFSNNLESVKKCIDLFKKQADNSLFNNSDFQRSIARVKKDCLLWGYQNNRKYYQEILRRYTQSSLQGQGLKGINAVQSLSKMKPFMNLINVFKNTVFYMDYDQAKSGVVITSYYSFDRERDEDGFLKIFNNKEVDKNMFNLIPKNIIGYYSGSHDFLNSWSFTKKIISSFVEMIKAEIGADPRQSQYADKIGEFSLDSALKSAESFLGVNIETDFFPLVGDNSGVVFLNLEDTDVKSLGVNKTAVPFPWFYFFLDLKDNSKAAEVMNKAVNGFVDNINKLIHAQQAKFKAQRAVSDQEQSDAQNEGQGEAPVQPPEEEKMLNVKVDNYDGVDITNIEIKESPIDFLKPNYCFLDKYIIFSLSEEVTKKAIDTYKDKNNSFALSLDFEAIQAKRLPKYFNNIFFDFKKLIKDISLTSSFNKFRSGLNNTEGEEFSAEDMDSVMKILDNLSTLDCSISLIDPDVMEASIYLKVNGL